MASVSLTYIFKVTMKWLHICHACKVSKTYYLYKCHLHLYMQLLGDQFIINNDRVSAFLFLVVSLNLL